MNYTTLITPEQLQSNLEQPNLTVVDCRFSLQDTEKSYQNYKEAHIPKAHYAHLDRDLSGPIIPGKTGRHPLPEVTILVSLFSSWGIDANQQVVVYDQKSGAIAARLWWMLKWLGHERVAVLEGGWHNWQEKDLPIDSEIPKKQVAHFIPNERKDWLVNAAFVEKIRQDDSYHLIDSRAKNRYAGLEEPIDPVAGHIPGAQNLPFMENIDGEGQFIAVEKLKERFKGLENAEQTIFYCGSGVTACHNILAYHHLEMGNPKLYPGSWSDWITDPNRPIA